MSIFKNRKFMIVASLAVVIPTAAYAGTRVYGYGDTRTQAIRDANNQAAEMSQQRHQRNTCYIRATHNTCSQDGESWICRATVDNQRGSCRSAPRMPK